VNATANANYNNFSANYSQGSLPAPGSNVPGSASYPSYGAGVNLTQPLFRPQNYPLYDQAQIQVAQAESQLAFSGQDLIARVAQAYFDVLLSQYNLITVRAQKAATAEQLAQAKRNFQVGTATITDTYDAQARFDLVTAQEITGVNDIEVKRRALQQIIGRLPGEARETAGRTWCSAHLSPTTWKRGYRRRTATVCRCRSPKLISIWLEKKSSAAAMRTTRPIDAVGTANYLNQQNGQLGYGQALTTLAIGVQLNLPIYQGGAVELQGPRSDRKQIQIRRGL
jgi:outer membrane protein